MIGLYLSDHDSYAAVNSMISMPLFFTSSALMPYEVMPAWLKVMVRLNPVSYAIVNTRMLFEGGIPVYGILGLDMGAGIMVLSEHISSGRQLCKKRNAEREVYAIIRREYFNSLKVTLSTNCTAGLKL